jgi:hypothetical protein
MRTASPPLRRLETSAPGTLFSRGLYVGIVAVMTGIVLIGFWPFYSTLFRGGAGSHWVIHLHAAVFSGWMVLLFTQVTLVFQRRTRLHQRLGRFGILYGLLVLLLGVAVTFAASAQHVAAGRSTLDEMAAFLILPLGDMLLFGGFFAAGIALRRRKEVHKRLMVLATIALLFAPAARIAGDMGPVAILPIWLLPLGLAMAHDAVTRRRVERVYLLGLGLLLVAFARVFAMETEAWLGVGRRLLLPFVGS